MDINLKKMEELTQKIEDLRAELENITYVEAHERFKEIEREFSENRIPFKMDWAGFADGGSSEDYDEESSYDPYDYEESSY